jgi:tetratricopeptide (TPR) repeat protein
MPRNHRARAAGPTVRPQPPAAPDTPRGIRIRAAILLLAGALAYANSLSGPFIFDDDASIVENTTIREMRPATALFPHRESPTAGRPVVNLSLAINYALGGLDVTSYHIGNIVIHLLCALTLFGIVRRTFRLRSSLAPPSYGGQVARRDRSLDLAFAAALIWVVHPLNSDAVDYLTQRTESLMALFYLLTLYCAIRAAGPAAAADDARVGPHAHLRWTVAAIVSCALGVGCKESMATAPVAVMLYDRVFMYASWKDAFTRRRLLYAGLIATWIPLAFVVASGPRVHSAGFRAGVDAWTYLVNQAVMIVRYLRLAVWPQSLVLAYGPPQPLSVGAVVPQAAMVLALLAMTGVALARRPALGFLGAWFFLTLAPASTIVPVATEVGAERRMYLPLAGLVVLAVVAVGPRLHKRAAAVLLAVLCAALAARTILRAQEYRSSITMAQTVLDRWPNGFAHALVGVELANVGRHDEALTHLREGALSYSPAHYHLGRDLFDRGRTAEALPELEQFVRENPEMLEAVRARTMIGRALMQQHRYTEAEEQFRMVLSMAAPSSDAHITATGFLGDALFGQADFRHAIDQFRVFLAARPNDAGGQTHFAIALASTGQMDEATRAFRRAVELNPSDATARQNLASHLFNLGQLDAAAAEAAEIVKIKPDHAGAHDLLGRVYGSQGRLADARAELERAVQIDPGNPQIREDFEILRRAAPGPGRRD